MPATRFILRGYGIGVILGVLAGLHYGQLAGWLTAWLGGGVISLLVAWVWYRGLGFGRAVRPAEAALQTRAAARQPNRAHAMPGERRGSSAGVFRGCAAHPVSMRLVHTDAS